MSPRDKVLAEFLEELADYVLAPQAATWDGERQQQYEQRERVICAQVWLQSAANVLRDPKAVSQYLSPAELHATRLELVRKYAAEPLPYEPYQADAADLPEAGTE